MDEVWDQAAKQSNDLEWEPEFEEPVEEEIEEPISQEVLGLLYVGKLSDTFVYGGHRISLRTLTIGEELAAGLLVKEYEGTRQEPRAIATVIVGACIESVDGRPIVTPLGPDEADLVRQKFEYVKDRWYWPTIRTIYEKYLELLEKQTAAVEEFRKK